MGLPVSTVPSNIQLLLLAITVALLLGFFFQERILYYFIVATMPLHHNTWLFLIIGAGAVPVLVPALAGSVIAKRLLGNGSFRFPRMMAPAVIFIAVAAVSVLFAESKDVALMAWERALVRVLLFPYLAWLIFTSLRPEAQVKVLSRQTTVVLSVAFVGVLLSFLQILTGGFYFISIQWETYAVVPGLSSRPIGLADYPVAWGAFLIIPFFMMLTQASAGTVLYKWFGVGVLLIALLLSGTRSAWLGALIGMIWLLPRSLARSRAFPLMFLFIVLSVAGVIFSVTDFADIWNPRIETGMEGIISRAPLLLAAAMTITSHPIIGVGIGNFPLYVLNHANEILGGFMTEYWQHWIVSGEGFHPHNMVLTVGAEIGVFGLIALCWLLWRGWKNFDAFSLPRGMDDSLSRGISLMRIRDGLQAAYLGIIVFSFFQQTQHYLFLWFLIATSFMLKSHADCLRITAQQRAPRVPAASRYLGPSG